MAETKSAGHDDVLDGVVVEPPAAFRSRRAPRPVVIAVNGVRTAGTHPHALAVARNIAYTGIGVWAVARSIYASRSTAHLDRLRDAAAQSGQHQAALDWEAAKQDAIQKRHDRRVQRREMFLATVRAAPWIIASAFGAEALAGVLDGINHHAVADVGQPFVITAHVVAVAAEIVSAAWGPIVLAAPWAALAGLWYAGRQYALKSGRGPWMQVSASDDDIEIDERSITAALTALRIPAITDYVIRQRLPLAYLVPARTDGRGTHAQIRLPSGVTAEKIARRRADLASGLHRQAKEVWPATGPEAGILDLWIADKGALAEGAGPYPLLDSGFTDVFRGVPFGKSLRGNPVTAPVMERNTITGGMPGQGKSSAARVIMAGAALDPTAELRIWVPDSNFDFEAFRPRCSRYVMGAEDECIRQIRDDLRELKAEVQARGRLLIEHGVPAVTRELASANVGLHPVVALLEEAHVAIQHPEFGKEIAQLLVDIVKLGRKRAIHLLVSTQAPTKDSMPRDVTRNCSNGIAFAVGDHVANDALLGQGAYAAGHRATELIPGTDRGTSLVKGFSGERSEMAQVYYLDVTKGHDQVTPIIERSLGEIARRGRTVPGTDRDRQPIEQRDLLADLDNVLGADGDRVRLSDVPALLRGHARHWLPYQQMTGAELADLLDGEGVRWTNGGNVPRLDPADLRAVTRLRDDSEDAA
jgi:S-DNA-T family DNA segregation ATPase FtsK/SpoIIIE